MEAPCVRARFLLLLFFFFFCDHGSPGGVKGGDGIFELDGGLAFDWGPGPLSGGGLVHVGLHAHRRPRLPLALPKLQRGAEVGGVITLDHTVAITREKRGENRGVGGTPGQ